MPVQDGQQHGETVVIHAHGHAAGRRQVGFIDQGLDLDQHRTAALAHDHNDAARRVFLTSRQENRGRVSHLLEAGLGHGEHAQFVDGAEPVLEGADDAEAAAAVPFEIQDGIDHVLQHPGPCQRPLLGDVTDQKHGGSGLLGESHQLRRALPHLGHGTRGRLEQFAVNGLDRVHDQIVRPLRCSHCQDALQFGRGQNLHRRAGQLQPPGAQADLTDGLLARDVEHPMPQTQGGDGLQQKGGFADARITADEHGGTGHQASAKYTVELLQATRGSVNVLGFHAGQRNRLRRDCAGRTGKTGKPPAPDRRLRVFHAFHQGIPDAAARALARPLVLHMAAFGTAMNRLAVLAATHRHGLTPLTRVLTLSRK